MAAWIEQLQAHGRYTFTRGEAESDTRRSADLVKAALRRQKTRGRVASPRRGFYVIVPPEYRATGAPPASWFIDDLMHYLGQPYYVGILSAAAIHGAAHQRPMVFQVVTDRPTRDARIGNVHLEFSMSRKVASTPAREIQTETGTMRVSTPEATAFDLVRYPAAAGHLSNVTTVLMELAERIDTTALAAAADTMRVPDIQRLGYLLEAVDQVELAATLLAILPPRRPRTVKLDPAGPNTATIDRRWRLRPNVDLELDL
jgi:predicted transcriptional regulator of viral defense system